MVRFLRSTHLASVALLLALPGWTTGAGELFKAVVGLASAADTNRLAQDLASTVTNAAGVASGVAGGASIAQDLLAADPTLSQAVGSVPTDATTSLAQAAAGSFVSAPCLIAVSLGPAPR